MNQNDAFYFPNPKSSISILNKKTSTKSRKMGSISPLKNAEISFIKEKIGKSKKRKKKNSNFLSFMSPLFSEGKKGKLNINVSSNKKFNNKIYSYNNLTNNSIYSKDNSSYKFMQNLAQNQTLNNSKFIKPHKKTYYNIQTNTIKENIPLMVYIKNYGKLNNVNSGFNKGINNDNYGKSTNNSKNKEKLNLKIVYGNCKKNKNSSNSSLNSYYCYNNINNSNINFYNNNISHNYNNSVNSNIINNSINNNIINIKNIKKCAKTSLNTRQNSFDEGAIEENMGCIGEYRVSSCGKRHGDKSSFDQKGGKIEINNFFKDVFSHKKQSKICSSKKKSSKNSLNTSKKVSSISSLNTINTIHNSYNNITCNNNINHNIKINNININNSKKYYFIPLTSKVTPHFNNKKTHKISSARLYSTSNCSAKKYEILLGKYKNLDKHMDKDEKLTNLKQNFVYNSNENHIINQKNPNKNNISVNNINNINNLNNIKNIYSNINTNYHNTNNNISAQNQKNKNQSISFNDDLLLKNKIKNIYKEGKKMKKSANASNSKMKSFNLEIDQNLLGKHKNNFKTKMNQIITQSQKEISLLKENLIKHFTTNNSPYIIHNKYQSKVHTKSSISQRAPLKSLKFSSCCCGWKSSSKSTSRKKKDDEKKKPKNGYNFFFSQVSSFSRLCCEKNRAEEKSKKDKERSSSSNFPLAQKSKIKKKIVPALDISEIRRKAKLNSSSFSSASSEEEEEEKKTKKEKLNFPSSKHESKKNKKSEKRENEYENEGKEYKNKKYEKNEGNNWKYDERYENEEENEYEKYAEESENEENLENSKISENSKNSRFSNYSGNSQNSQSSKNSSFVKDASYYKSQSEKLGLYIRTQAEKKGKYPRTEIGFYKYGRLIGQGAFGQVNLGLNVLTGRAVAIKSFLKDSKFLPENMRKVKHEIEIMSRMKHKNVIRLLEVFETEKFFFIVMEYVNGGNLFSFVKKRRKVSEKIAKFIFRQIIDGIKYIHSKGVVHRDIKLENILIDLNNNIKICDFGISKFVSPSERLVDQCGTPMYMAPEILTTTGKEGYEGFKVDIWSAGIALYIMLSGTLPFDVKKNEAGINVDVSESAENLNAENENNILQYCIVNCEPKEIEGISSEAKSILKCLLEKDPKKRIKLNEILAHPWLSFSANNNKIQPLFTESELMLLSKSYIDYRKAPVEDIKENFSCAKIAFSGEKKSNESSKSSILAPFNSVRMEEDNLDISESYISYEDVSINNAGLCVFNDILKFSHKVKEFNLLYELNNNGEVDNGILIRSRTNTQCSENNSRVERYDPPKPDLDPKKRKECVLAELETLGYSNHYILNCVENNVLNYGSACYYLLYNYGKY